MSLLTPSPLDFLDPERLSLAQILKSPVLARATEIARRRLAPKAAAGLMYTTDQQVALANQSAGVDAFLRELEQLSEPLPESDLGVTAQPPGTGEFEYDPEQPITDQA